MADLTALRGEKEIIMIEILQGELRLSEEVIKKATDEEMIELRRIAEAISHRKDKYSHED